MIDSVGEVLDYDSQERRNRLAFRKRLTVEAKQQSVGESTGIGHYWYVTPPPTQTHHCRDCDKEIVYTLNAENKFIW